MARPTKYNDERVKRILTALAAGNTRRAACAAASVSQETFAHWLSRYIDFSDAVKRAEAEAELRMVAIIQAAAPETWQAAAWYLERKHPDEWGRRERLDLKLQLVDETRRLAEELGLSPEDTAAAIREAEAVIKGK